MEKFAIRSNSDKFLGYLHKIKENVENLEYSRVPLSSAMHVVELRELSVFCKEQSLTTIGKVSPYRQLQKYANYLDTMVSAALVDENENHYNMSRSAFIQEFPEFVKEIETRLPAIPRNPDDVDPTERSNARNESTLRVVEERLANEARIISALKPKKPNEPVFVKGSVAVHQFFKNLKIDNSVIKFGTLSFGSKPETIVPITVLHNQTLMMIKLKPRKFHFRKQPLTLEEIGDRKQVILESLKDRNFKDTDFDMSIYVSGGILMSRAFKGYSFVWLMDRAEHAQLEHMPENKSYLMWSKLFCEPMEKTIDALIKNES